MTTLVVNVDCHHSAPPLIKSGMPWGNETTLSITGLIGSATPTNPQLPLTGAGAAIFGNSGFWDQKYGTLTLKVAAGQRVSAGAAILITFSLTNSMRGQQSPSLFTYVAGTCARTNGSLALPRRYIDVDLDTALDEVASVVGDAAPLLIRSPSFLVRKIAQSNPSAGGANTITLILAANVDLDSTALLTIHGLTPTSTPTSPRVLLAGGYSLGASAASRDLLASRPAPGVGSYAFYGDSWTSNDGGLTWLQVSNASASSWSPREGFALAVANASVFLAGGWGGPLQGYLKDVWASTDVGKTWQLVAAFPPWAPRGYFEMVRSPSLLPRCSPALVLKACLPPPCLPPPCLPPLFCTRCISRISVLGCSG